VDSVGELVSIRERPAVSAHKNEGTILADDFDAVL
jgi:hypothetical protein